MALTGTRWPPRGLTGWLARRALPPGCDDPASTAARTRLGEFEGYVSTVISILLTAVKITLGLLAGSLSLMADAVNNATDIVSSLMIAFACRWSRKPRDLEHPFGHGRMETVATLILSICLIVVAIEVAKAGVDRLLHPLPLQAPAWLVAVIALTVLVKSWLAVFARTLARASKSEVLEADAWNHTFDILSTSLVLVALFGARLGVPQLDAYAGLGVSVFIGITGVKYAKRATNTLIGSAPDPDELARIHRIARSVPGVRDVHDVLVHAYGDVKLVSLHIEVDAGLTVMEAHTLAEQTEAALAREILCRAVAHVDPVDRTHVCYIAAEEVIRRMVSEHPALAGFHDLRLTGGAEHFDLSVDIVTAGEVQSDRFPELSTELKSRIHERLPAAQRIEISLETEMACEHDHRRTFQR